MSSLVSSAIGGTGAAILGSSLLSGIMGSSASQSAANTQSQAATQAAQLQYQSTQSQLAQQMQIYNTNLANQQPWITQGQGANTQLANLMGTSGNTTATGYGSLAATPTLANMQANMNPNYEFMLQQGQQALQSSAAATGGLLTGQGAKDITNYAQQTAQSGLQQGYQNYVTNQTNLYNRLSGISGLGQNAAAGVGNQGVQTGANLASTQQAGTSAQNNYLTGAAASQAAGAIGTANAWSGAANSGINNYTTMSYLNGLNGGTGSMGSGTPITTAMGSNGLSMGMGGSSGSYIDQAIQNLAP